MIGSSARSVACVQAGGLREYPHRSLQGGEKGRANACGAWELYRERWVLQTWDNVRIVLLDGYVIV
jgi:hypothetical protein